MKGVVDINGLKEKHPEQMKWLAKELYKIYMHEGYRNIYNYFQSKCDKYGPEREYIIEGPDAELKYEYMYSNSKKLVGEINGKEIFTFYQSGWGDGGIAEYIREYLNEYHGEEDRLSKEQIAEWLKIFKLYYNFFLHICKETKTQVNSRMEKVCELYEAALEMPFAKAKTTFEDKEEKGKALFDYSFNVIEKLPRIRLLFDWESAPAIQWCFRYEFFNLSEKDFERFKRNVEGYLQTNRIKGYASEETKRFRQRYEELKAMARANKEANLKGEIARLSGDKK